VHRSLAAACALALILAASSPAAAQDAGARYGQKFLTVGVTAQPGVLSDPTADTSTTGLYPSAYTHAQMLKLGLHHVMGTQFMMSGELDLGALWVNEHTASPDGRGDSELTTAFQAAVVGRFIPSGDLGGFQTGVGLQWFRANLADAPYQSLGLDLRAGAIVWQDDARFAIVDLAYGLPLIDGLELPTDFTGERGPIAQPWSWHRLSLSIQVNL
jgi:hypothetical protein